MKKIILLVVAAIAAASYLAYAYMNGDPMFGTLAKTMDDLPRNERLGSKRNSVVLGVDGREKDDDPGRSDTLFVVMFDPKSKNVSLLSIPRDTRVRIPGHGWDKINHAYAFGGHKLTQQTTEELLGIQVNNYVMVDFSGFEGLIDAIGGIDIDVEKDMYYEDPYADLVIDIKHGYQHLDGKRAGEYVRFRKDELGDIGRVQRQQKFMKAAAAQIFNIDTVTKIPALFSTVDRHVETDMNTLTMIKAANSFKLFGDEKVKSGMLYGNFDDTEGISYWATSREEVQKSLDEVGIPYMKDDEDEQE